MEKERPRLENFGLTIRFFKKFSAPILRKFVYTLPILLIVTAVSLVEPYVYKMVVDELTKGNAMNVSVIVNYLVIWSAVTLVGLVLFAIYRVGFSYFLTDVEKNYLHFAYENMLDKDLRYHLEKKSGEIMKKIDRGLDSFWGILFVVFIDLFPAVLSLVAVLVFSFYVSWQMALVSLIMLPFSLIIFVWGTLFTGKEQNKSMDHFDDAYGRAYDSMTNIMVVKSFAKEAQESKTFMGKLMKYIDLQRKTSVKWGSIAMAQTVIRTLNRIIVFAGGVYFIYQGAISVGVLIMFISFLGTIYGPIYSLGDQLRQFQKNFLALEEARKILEEKNQVMDVEDALDLKVQKGKIELKKINFTYKDIGVIKDVSITVEPGQMVALVGHSGAGKSTITALINRFYDLMDGEILIDGQNVAKVGQKSLRAQIGLVMQDNSMFNDTIYNNIAYAFPEAMAKDVEDAAKKANIHDFILSLPDGYETKVGERGLKLSGGEKQRVAIARVILKNPPILILDEATSALDSHNEKIIQEALEKLMQGRTSIVIAHRLSTVRKADKIVVMDKGHVVQEGTHAELVNMPGVYKDLVDLQVGGLLAL